MEMTRFNENTITDKKRYLQEVLKVKERGYGVDLEEEGKQSNALSENLSLATYMSHMLCAGTHRTELRAKDYRT